MPDQQKPSDHVRLRYGFPEVVVVLGGPSGEVAGGHPDREVAGDPIDAGLGDDVVFPAGGVAADDLIAAFVQDGDRGEPGRVVFRRAG